MLVATLALTSSLSFAQTTVTFTASTDKGADGGTAATTVTLAKDGITLTASGAATNSGVFGNGSNYRIYKGATLEIKSTVGNITKVVFTCTATGTNQYGPGCFAASSVSTGTYVAGTDQVGTWTGNAASFTIKATSNQVRATKIEVTYTADANAVTPPTISGTNPFQSSTTVTIAGGNNTVYYTLNGSTPTTASTQYTAPFTLSETTTVKAIAYKDGKASEVTTKEFKKMPATVGAGTAASPFTIADAYTLSNAGTLPTGDMYFEGTVKRISEVSTQYKNITYSIQQEGTTDTLTVFRGKQINKADITDTNKDWLKVGDKVIVVGTLTVYNNALQLGAGNYLYSVNGSTAGINGVKADDKEIDKNAPIYNLAGQRVGEDYKGVVIQDGHKYIKK